MGTSGQSVTLANSIIGVGILAMPFCFQKCGVLLATLMLLMMGFVSRLSCYFLLKSALISRRWNFEFLGFHIFGPLGKLAVEVGIIGFLMGTCIAYFVVVGDLGPQIIAKMLNINQSDVLRTSVMVLVSLLCVLPLGLLRNVDSLSNVSAATVGFYFCLVLKVVAEAMIKMISGDRNIEVELWKPSGMLQCVPIFSMALFCQTQLFEIFESLPKLSLEKMNVVTKNAINICTTVYLTLGLFGYIAFSSQEISGNVLVSLSETWASDVIKLGFVMSVAFSFPLIIFPCRASLYSLIYRKAHTSHHDNIINHSIPEVTFRCITIGIIVITLLVSLMIPDIEVVLGLVGSTIGVLICVVFPSACFINVIYKNTNEKLLAKLVLMIGLLILILGTYANLQAAESKMEHYDEKYITQEKIDKIVQDFFDSKKLSKSEDVILKPLSDVNEEVNKDIKDTIVESEVQPPNPVPPESKEALQGKNVKSDDNVKHNDYHGDELKQHLNPEQKLKNLEEMHMSEQKIVKNDINSPPKIINQKISNDVKESNGINNKKSKETNGINQPEKPKEQNVAKSSDNQEKNDMLKQQKLMDTIKQHGREQKELLKEQKEILQKMAKTKEEIDQKQKDKIDTDDPKKIAVESIQKIANLAIQSLGGMTEKHIENGQENLQKDNSNVENLANNAEEVAKKALEAIEALKDDNNNAPLQQNNVVSPVQQKQHVNSDIVGASNVLQNKPVALTLQNQLIQNKQQNTEQGESNILEKVDNVINQAKGHSHSPDEPQSYIRGEDLQKQKNVAPGPSNIVPNVPIPVAMNPSSGINNYYQHITDQKENPNKTPPPVIPNNNKQQQQINNNQHQVNSIQPNQLEHSQNQQLQQSSNLKQEIKQNNENNDQSNGVLKKINLLQENVDNNFPQKLIPDEHDRQKREVIDCTEMLLKPEDKQICDTLVVHKAQEVLLPKPDLTDGLPRSIPLDNNVIFHIRSLKNVDDQEKR